MLLQVYCFPFPVQENDQVTEERDLYTPIYNTIYHLVNVAAEALGLNVKLSKAKGRVGCHLRKQAARCSSLGQNASFLSNLHAEQLAYGCHNDSKSEKVVVAIYWSHI